MQDIRSDLLTWVKEGRTPIALATVIELEGSGLRKPGATLAVSADGEILGSISGGCVEPQVLEKAEAIISHARTAHTPSMAPQRSGTEQAALLRLEADTDPLHSPLAPCSTAMEIALCLLDAKVLEQVERACSESLPFVWGILLSSNGGTRGSSPSNDDIDTNHLFAFDPQTHTVHGEQAVLEPLFLSAELHSRLSKLKEASIFWTEGRRVFACPVAPRPRLIIVGASHIAQHLSTFATALDYEVVVGDPRERFLSRERFPQSVELRSGRVDRLLHTLAPDHNTAVAVVSHDDKIDDVALAVAVESPAFYIGALGSRKTQANRRQRLAADGLSTSSLDRIHGPIGLPIKAVGPAEIAVAILAEIVASSRNRDYEPA